MLEFGSGASTVRWALEFPSLSIVSFEHNMRYFHETRSFIQEYGVQDRVELQYAPLENIWIGGKRFTSYAKPDISGKYEIIIIDGPPTHSTKRGREACLYYAYNALRIQGIAILDDVNREDEKTIVQNWLHVYPGSFEYLYVNIGNGLAILRKVKHLKRQRLSWSALSDSYIVLSQQVQAQIRMVTVATMMRKANNLLGEITGYKLSRYVKPAPLELVGALGYREALETFLVSNKSLVSGRVLEIGPGTWDFVRILVESVDAEVEYFAIDPSPSSSRVIRGTIEQIESIFKHKFQTIIACEVFEHLKSPESAIHKVYEFLEDGGVFIASTPFRKNLHGEEYGDYWRITRQGWAYLLQDFADVKIVPHGDPLFPKAYFVLAVK